MRTFTTFASVTFLSLAALSPSQAADTLPQSRTVRFSDLDLSRIEDAATLFSRIRDAAKAVCSRHDSKELARQQRYVACIDFAVSTAVARVDEPVLTNYVASRGASERNAAPNIASRR